MSQKNQIWILAGTSLVLGAATAFLAYKNYTLKETLAAWYANQSDAIRGTLPQEIQTLLKAA